MAPPNTGVNNVWKTWEFVEISVGIVLARPVHPRVCSAALYRYADCSGHVNLLTPPNRSTGVVAVQNMGSAVRRWRISATGVVLELDAQFRIMKKLKLVGTPFKVWE